MEQYSSQYGILGGCHNFCCQETPIFVPSTCLLCVGMDFRVGVKFLENGVLEAVGCLDLSPTQLCPWHMFLAVPLVMVELSMSLDV